MLPTPNKKSSFAEWQEAYNFYFTMYAKMSPDFMDPDEANYRLREQGTRWAHQMVDACLGPIWQEEYANTKPEKRDKFWKKLKENSTLLPEQPFRGPQEDGEACATSTPMSQQQSLF